MIYSGVFGPSVELKDRLKSFEEIGKFSENCKGLGLKVVLTQGSWDLYHVSHKAYLAKAKSFGDVLVVGVDSDEKIRERKGKDRPMVPQNERLDLLAGQRSVGVLVLKETDHPKWGLIKQVKPDVLVVSATTRKNKPIPQEEIDEIKKFCGEIVILEAQGQATTSAKIALFNLSIANRIKEALERAIPGIIESVTGPLGGKE